MTITHIQRPASLQSYSHTNNSNYTQSDYNATQSEVEFYIQSLINEGNVFQAKYHMEMVNTMNGYPVISMMQFKQWRVAAIRNGRTRIEISKVDNRFLKKQKSISLKGLSDKRFSVNQNPNMLKEYKKSYMSLLSN